MDFAATYLRSYPTTDKTNPAILMDGLGSFWNQIFQERATVKGYTMGMSEELIQMYRNLVEAVNTFSTRDIPVFHKEHWYPLQIQRSSYNKVPLLFKPNDSVFGIQPETDAFFRGQLFRFGRAKTPSDGVYAFTPDATFRGSTVIANRVLAPSLVMVQGTDYVLQDGSLYFNTDLFDNPLIPKTDIISDTAAAVEFVDNLGVTRTDQLIVLWCYCAELDAQYLTGNFGYLFNLSEEDNDALLKALLHACFSLSTKGATVKNIKTVCAAFLGLKAVVESKEVVEEVFTDSTDHVVVTDLNVYKFPIDYTLRTEVVAGYEAVAGDLFVDAVDYFDNVSWPNWWTAKMGPKVAFSQHVFLGSYQQQLVLANDMALLSVDALGNVVFPIEGTPQDVATFHNNLDHEAITTALNLPVSSSLLINPLDFLFQYFFKESSALIRFRFTSKDAGLRLFRYMPILLKYLPKHVYFIFDLELEVVNEVYENFNDCISVVYPTETRLLNSDGSNSVGFIDSVQPQAVVDDPSDPLVWFREKLLVVGKSPELTNVTVTMDSASGEMSANTGKLITVIPSGASTASVAKLFLVDFS